MGHATLGFCWWDLPAAILLIAIIVFFYIRIRNLRKKQSELEEMVRDAKGDDVSAEYAVPLDNYTDNRVGIKNKD